MKTETESSKERSAVRKSFLYHHFLSPSLSYRFPSLPLKTFIEGDGALIKIHKRKVHLLTTILCLLLTAYHLSTVSKAHAEVSKSTSTSPSQKVQTASKEKEKEKIPSLWDIVKNLSTKKFVDLTHSFKPGIPKWKGYPDEKRKTLYHYNQDGFWAEQYTLVGQWGTHVDPPAHFHQGLRTVDEIPLNELIAPLVVINMSEKAERNPDIVLTVEDIKRWESKYGKIPEGAFVAMRTDWSRKWPELNLMQNRDDKGVMHYPGWSVDALKFLVEQRNIVAIGHETTDTDAGFNVFVDRYPAQTYIHGQNHYQIELMSNLNLVPEYGAMVVVSFPKPEKGSGFPARVFAILP